MKHLCSATAHYHGVLIALTVALMGLTYFSLKENNLLKFDRFARLQPFVFTLGMFILILCLFFAGKYGAPRKTFGFSWVVNDTVIGYLNILAIGAALSVLGGLMYVFYSIASLITLSRRVKQSAVLLPLLLLFCSFKLPNEAQFLGKPVADITVFDSKGNSFLLSDLIKEKPVILSPIYTKCPTACSAITANLKKSISEVDGLGNSFKIITFSFDSADTPEDLKAFEEKWELTSDNWKVVSAKGNNISALLSSIDFEIEWNAANQQYDHPNVLIIVMPSGKISKYVHGVAPETRTLKIALMEARKEKTSLSFYEGLYIRCFVYDPATQSYVIDRKFILMLISGGLTISGMLFFVVRSVVIK